ncbi:hypothetical protein JXR93_08435 [bacterium]|nr:hypothetical protein [bacterium]
MATVIINGKRVEVPDGSKGKDLKEMVPNSGEGRRVVIQKGMDVIDVEDYKDYKKELINEKGKPVKITTIPDRTKGASD